MFTTHVRLLRGVLHRISIAVWLVVVLPGNIVAALEDRPTVQQEDTAGSRFNLWSPTLGGTQFWTDEFIFREWRIQRHNWTDHYRLLDEHDVRRAWGTFQECRQRFEELRREEQMAPLGTTVVLLVHGLGRTRGSMEDLCEYLQRHSDFEVLSMGYASTRAGINDHAAALAKVLNHLEGVQRIHLVAHSMGNIVIRRYLARSAAGGQTDQRLGRIVMLAPPNNGAQIANRLRGNKLFQAVMGASGTELGRSPEEFERDLAVPSCPFGIIAGGTGEDQGYNRLLPGDDDFIVTVAETRLPGAADFAVVHGMHTLLLDQATVHEYTLRFLEHGYFIAEEKRCPIPAEDEP